MNQFVDLSVNDFEKMYSMSDTKIMIDIKGLYDRSDFENNGFYYWSL